METQPGVLTPNNSNVTPSSCRRVRPSPLPSLNMSDSTEMWESMVTVKEIYVRDVHLLARHPNITPRMRSILLDWLSEVSELFKLHRETFYLALDFVDRYLSKKSDLPRQHLQLIGTTCLFIAAKIEEVYPPKIVEFAAVTDGACTDAEIFGQELVIMETLKWSLHPVTVNKWLSVYLQIYSILEKENNQDPEARPTGEKFLIPNYSGTFFVQIAHLIDLCMLDMGSLHYAYDVIAAAALYHFTDEETVFSCSRFKYLDIRDCVIWMTPFALAVRETGILEPKVPANAPNGSWSTMQYHTVDLTLLERAHLKQIDLTEDSSDESASPSLPPSPVNSSPFAVKSKAPLKNSSSTNVVKSKMSPKKSNSPITLNSSPIACSSNALVSSPTSIPCSSSGLGSSASSPNPLSTTSSPPPHRQSQSAFTPSSICKKPAKQQKHFAAHQTPREDEEESKSGGNKRKRDLNNNQNEDESDEEHDQKSIGGCIVESDTKSQLRRSSRRTSKKRRTVSHPKSSPVTL